MATAESIQQYFAGEIYVTKNLCIILKCDTCHEQFGVYTKFLDHIFGKHFDNWTSTDKSKDSQCPQYTKTNEQCVSSANNEAFTCIAEKYVDPNDLTADVMDDDALASNSITQEDFQAEPPTTTVPNKNVRPVKVFARQETNSQKERKHKCSTCGKTFMEKCHLYNHEQRHSHQRAYACLKCDKGFFTSTELVQHSRRHTGETPYVCTYCGKGFISTGLLNKHERRHTGNGSHKCDHCDKSFYDFGKLKVHLTAVHSQERNYKCDKCESKFACQKYLSAHMKIHENALRYECFMCQKRFNQKPALNWHIKSKHNVLPQGSDSNSITPNGPTAYDYDT